MTEVYLTVKAWHLAFFLVALVSLWNLFPSGGISADADRQWKGSRRGRQRRRSAAAQHLAAAAFDAVPAAQSSDVGEALASSSSSASSYSISSSVAEQLPPPLPSVASGPAQAGLRTAQTESLIAELHSRKYDWDILARAGLQFSSLHEVELLHYLKRDHGKFNSLLAGAQLGLSTHSTTQLLKELSRREDLAGALRESGLGSGADFQCAFDESPRDSGCQVRCSGGLPPCQRAEEKCKSLGHCVSVEVNRERTIGTLKSLQVYMPTPPPVCDGYAFHDNGSAPIAVAAPLDVTFDDLGGGDAPPNEGWCYRDTSVSQPPALPGARNGVNHNGLSGNPHCRMETCFDLDRCRPRRGDPPNAPLRLYIDTPTPKTYDMRRWPSCLRQTLRTAIVERAELACLVVPTVNLNCEWDVCDPATHSQLAAMRSWNRTGHNHVIWDYIDGPKVKYPTDEALFMKTSMRLSDYRPGFDVPFPLLPNGEASHVTPAELEAARGRRTVLASFKGVCQAKTQRPALQRMHDGRELIMLCTDRGGPGKNHYDYKTLMLTSVFSVAPAGNGLHSFRLAEAIFFGSIPVIVDDEIVLPFCSVLDWRRFSVRIRTADVSKLPQILRAIPPQQIAAMQARLAEVKRKYFLFPFNTALALMQLRVREALRKQDASRSGRMRAR